MMAEDTQLQVLPDGVGAAAANMAADMLLLEAYPAAGAARLRHYGWSGPAWTFGYSQKWAWAREQAPESAQPGAALVRRASGGGLVDHRGDWTWALVIPRGHALWGEPAPCAYSAVHEAVAAALDGAGAAVELAACPGRGAPKGRGGPGLCFVQAEPADVVRAGDGRKVAGAAMKRTRAGLLLQGSIDCAAAGVALGGGFRTGLAEALGRALGREAVAVPEPPYPAARREELTRQFASQQWNARR